MAVQKETVRTDGFAMDYFRFGHGRETLVILPGLSVQSVIGAADAVADAYRCLTDAFTVYVFDRRKDLPDAYPVRRMAQDTAAALRALGLERVCIFGASQGGMIAMQIAIDRPQLVRKLVLGSASACVTAEQYRTLGQWIRLAEERKPAQLYAAFGQALYPPDVFERLRASFADAAKTVTQEELDRFICLAQGTKDFDVTQQLEKIVCPALVIGAADDRVLGADASVQIARRLGGRQAVQLYMYDGCGHAAYDTAPDYPERLRRFLTMGEEPVKQYAFYGWETADIRDRYGLTPRDYYDLLSGIWCAETCAPRMRGAWTRENKTLGQCSITAFLMQDVFGGKVYGIPRDGGNFHCFNVVGDCVFDLTSEQFGDTVLDYADCTEQFREDHFRKAEKKARYEFLRKALSDTVKTMQR